MPLKHDLNEVEMEKARNAGSVLVVYFAVLAIGTLVGALIWRVL